MGPTGLALFEADARFHGERLAAYSARRHGSPTTNEARFKDLKRRSRLADGRLHQARVEAAKRAAMPAAGAAAEVEKLAAYPRAPKLDHLADVLEDGEGVVSVAEALFQSATRQWGGLAVLTDRRLLCVAVGVQQAATLEFPLAGISSIEASFSGGVGGARRGELSLLCDGERTRVLRINPWERAAEIAAFVEAWPNGPWAGGT
jgi:hypothetical protein